MKIDKMVGVHISDEVTIQIIVKEVDRFLADTGENLRTVPLIIFLNYLRGEKTDTTFDYDDAHEDYKERKGISNNTFKRGFHD